MLQRITKLALVAGLGFGLSACAQLYDQGISATTDGPAFNVELLSQYQRLAKLEAIIYEQKLMEYLAASALRLGFKPKPEAADHKGRYRAYADRFL